jgi:hypothetical protein
MEAANESRRLNLSASRSNPEMRTAARGAIDKKRVTGCCPGLTNDSCSHISITNRGLISSRHLWCKKAEVRSDAQLIAATATGEQSTRAIGIRVQYHLPSELLSDGQDAVEYAPSRERR